MISFSSTQSPQILPYSSQDTKPTKNSFFRPALEAIKITAAIFDGAMRGPEKALNSLSTTGAPVALSGAVSAYAISSGKEGSLLEGFPDFINSDPQAWFFAALIKGSLLHELADHPFHSNNSENSELTTLSLSNLQQLLSQKDTKTSQLKEVITSLKSTITLAETQKESYSTGLKDQLTSYQNDLKEIETEKRAITKAIKERSTFSDAIENFAISLKLVDPTDFCPYATTATKVSSWASSIATIAFFGALLHYELDSKAYQNHTFSEYLNDHLLQPIQTATSFIFKK